MTCYDCLHHDACSNAGDGGYSYLKEDSSKCKYFKNKADYVEIKHGEWKEREWTDEYQHICSLCHSTARVHPQSVEYRYCPYCGARMKEVQNETYTDISVNSYNT